MTPQIFSGKIHRRTLLKGAVAAGVLQVTGPFVIRARRTRNEGRLRALKALREQRRQQIGPVGRATIEVGQAEASGALVVTARNITKRWADGAPSAGEAIPCDCIAMSGGWTANVALHAQARADSDRDCRTRETG